MHCLLRIQRSTKAPALEAHNLCASSSYTACDRAILEVNMGSVKRSATDDYVSGGNKRPKIKEFRWKPLDSQRNELRILELHGLYQQDDEERIAASLHNSL